MKIDRRSFLSLAIGGAAGTALSPLPWKIVDDAVIWTQNWPWTPVPEDGQVSYTQSVCTLCPAGCGISVRKINDRVVKIEGMKDSPVNSGGVCILGLCGPQLLYGPSRIQAPLKRIGERGSGQWKTISWDQAISEITEKLKDLRAQNKPQTVAAISGQKYGVETELLKRFLKAYGSPNCLHVPSSQDSYEQVLKLMNKTNAMAGFDIENATHVLSFGSGLLDGWGSPVRMFRAHGKLKKNKGKLVQVEPRLSNTAAKADPWVPINPGTEADLALGLAYVIIQELLYKRQWVDKNPGGFEAFKSFVISGYRPDKVSETTGIDTAAIISMAREFASASRPVAICGKGQGDTPGALAEFAAVHALNALMGNLNQPGGVWLMPKPKKMPWPDMTIDDVADKGLSQPRIDGAKEGDTPRLNKFAQSINDGYELEVLLVSGANPLYTLPDTQSVKAAMDKIGLIVSFSPFMDETAMYSDLILPDHMYLEKYTDVPCARGLNKPYKGMAKPVVKPIFHTRYTGDVILAVSKALGNEVASAMAWNSYEACLKQSMGMDFAVLKEKTIVVSDAYKAPLPSTFTYALAPFKNMVSQDKSAGEFNLQLVPYDAMRLANDAIGSPPFMVKTVSDTMLKNKDGFVEINPETAKTLSLSEGNKALLKTPKGEAKVKVHLFEGIKPGVIAMPKGLGHMAYDKFLEGKGVNVNTLIDSVEDPVSGLDAAWGIKARLAKL